MEDGPPEDPSVGGPPGGAGAGYEDVGAVAGERRGEREEQCGGAGSGGDLVRDAGQGAAGPVAAGGLQQGGAPPTGWASARPAAAATAAVSSGSTGRPSPGSGGP
ncbi:hypothetical protein SRO_1380 [Streptomyces rochei]|nr:hypothetical protein SRO_1380 [Streptomyces rochei]